MNELIGQLVSQLGVKEDQARGGAGLLLKLAQQALGADFSKITTLIGNADQLIGAAPQAGGLSKLAGGLVSALGGGKGLAGLAGLAAGFKQLNLDSAQIARFADVLVSFLKTKGGPEVAGLLQKAISK